MNSSFLCTFIGPDKPGLVELLANTVSSYQGNWLESSMTQLAGQFAGIVRIAVAANNEEALKNKLQQLEQHGLHVHMVGTNELSANTDTTNYQLRVVGNDRPGIVKEIAQALAQHNINVVNMETHLSSAPMSADQLFHAEIALVVPKKHANTELEQSLDSVADNLSIEIDLINPESPI